MTKKQQRKRRLAVLRILASLQAIVPGAAFAHGDAHIWPQWVDEESIVTIPPMGVVIDERWPDIDYRDIVELRASPTDTNCEAFEHRYGAGAAARVMNSE
jgi:hypothetical protein